MRIAALWYKSMHQQKGFSFIEILVVIGLITVFSGMVILTFHNYKPTMKINGAARQIFSDLMQARMKAVSENNNYVIAFTSSTNSYKIYDDDNNNFSVSTIEEDELIKTVSFDNIANKFYGVVFGFVPNTDKPTGGTVLSSVTPTGEWFRFEPNGRGRSGGIYLILPEDLAEGLKGRTRAITVSVAGKVKIWSYEKNDGGTDKWK